MKGEVVIMLENLGSRWMVFARWLYVGQEGEALQYVIHLGEAPTIEGAKAIAGLFGAATTNAVYKLAKDADMLRETGSGVYSAAGMADTLEVGSRSYAGHDVRRAAYNLERLTQPGKPCLHGSYGYCDACRQEHDAQLAAMHQAGIDYRGGMAQEPEGDASKFCGCTRRPADGSHVQACPLHGSKTD